MIKTLLTLTLLMGSLWATSCKDLNSDAKIRAFVSKTYKSHPLLRENISSTLDIKTKDGKDSKNQTVHMVRLADKKRSYFLKGENNPKCSVKKGDRDFLCNECTYTSNTLCRSYKGDDSTTKIQGTNIDTNDFKLLESHDFTNKCFPVKKNKKYVKIVSKKVSGNAAYNKIVSFYDVTKKISVTTNYFADGVLRKVYRFFPKYYKKIKNEWVSTVSRVRTVAGSEKKYSFETLINIKKDGKKNYLLYLSPKDDPKVSKRVNTLFNTNQ